MTVSSGVAITDVTVIDVRGGSLLEHRTVSVDGTRIAIVAPTADVKLGPDMVRVSGAGKYLIPGLWDMHVHVSPMLGGSAVLPLFTAHGVTGVRDAGSGDSIFAWQAEIARGDRRGPRIVAAGRMLVSYVSAGQAHESSSVEGVQSVEDARRAVRTRQGTAQYIKIQDSFMPRALWLAAAVEARDRGLPVAGHPPIDVTLEEAIAAGYRSIEHTIGLPLALAPGEAERRRRIMAGAQNPEPAVSSDLLAGYTTLFEVEAEVWDILDEARWGALTELMVRNGVALDPNLTDLRALSTGASGRWNDDPRFAYLPPATRAAWIRETRSALFSPQNSARAQIMFQHMPAIVARLHGGGVTILAGTDAGAAFDFPGSDIHTEMALLVDAGLTPLAALQAATLNPPEFMGMVDSAGTVEAGKVADLVLLDGNPLTDISHSTRIAGVVQAGHYFDKQALDSMLAAVRDQYR